MFYQMEGSYFCCWYSTGTTKVRNLEDNIGSLTVKLSEDDLKEICDAVPIDEVAGERQIAIFSQFNWKLANTPIKVIADQVWSIEVNMSFTIFFNFFLSLFRNHHAEKDKQSLSWWVKRNRGASSILIKIEAYFSWVKLFFHE